MTTTILLTGASGFLGGHILTALSRRDSVRIVAASRSHDRLPVSFTGEARIGDLTDPRYVADVVRGVDVVIHAGTWSSFWGHAKEERRLFLDPSIGLIDAAVAAGVGRFVAASTVAISTPAGHGEVVADDAVAVKRGYWPHLDAMVDVESHMRAVAGATQMTSLRLGHFIGEGCSMSLVSAIVPRLKTRQVPWVDHGRAHLPLVSGEDMGEAFARTALADGLTPFESINIAGAEQPTAREVFTFVAETAGVPKPAYSVPLRAAHGFGAVMESIHRVTPGKAPFLTRALVHVGENWHVSTELARTKLGFEARTDWREAASASIEARRTGGFAWPALAQPITCSVSAGAPVSAR